MNNLSINNTCLGINGDGIIAIESLPIYKTGGANLNKNCITKAELPNANITEPNCESCPSCKEINLTEKAALNAVLNGFHITS